jgi:long-chain fatty acid transport protein
MTFLCKGLALPAFVAFAVASAFGGGFQLNEHGARAMAQAGAFAARAYDGSAMYFNPGGFGFQTQGSAYFGGTLIFPQTSFYGPLQLNSNEKTEMVNQTFTPINVSISYPVVEGLVAAIGVSNPFGLGTEWPDTWEGRFIIQKVDLQSFFITPTLAYKLTDQLSVGLGFNYATGKVKLKREVSVVSVGTPSPVQASLDLNGTGVGFNAGVLYKITPEVSVGVSYRHKVKIEASGSATFNPNYVALGLPQGDVKSTLTLPATGFVGIAFKPMDNLELEADYQYIGWSTYKELRFDFSANGSTTVSPKNYEDTYILRFGGEYTIAPWHFRGGYLYDHSPVKLEYTEPLLPDANRNGINVGLGYDFNTSWSADVAYLLLLFDERNAKNTIPEISFDGTYRSHVNLVALNLEYKF